MSQEEITALKWTLGLESVLLLLLVGHLTYFFRKYRNMVITICIILLISGMIGFSFTDWSQSIQHLKWKKWFFLGLFGLITTAPYVGHFLKKFFKPSHIKVFSQSRGPLREVIEACALMSQSKTGALIAIERYDDLSSWIEKGLRVDANLKKEVLASLFAPTAPTHDGAVVIRGNRIAACGIIFPINQALTDLKVGTRHRAALGFSETTDSFVITVSEETGKIAFASNGILTQDVSLKELKDHLRKEMS